MNTQNRKIYLIIFVVVAVWFFIAFFGGFYPFKHGQTLVPVLGEKPEFGKNVPGPGLLTPGQSGSLPDSRGPLRLNSRETNRSSLEKSDEIDLVSLRFLPPEYLQKDVYKVTEPEVKFSRSCETRKDLKSDQFFSLLVRNLGMDIQNHFPSGVSFQSFAQFWVIDDIYYQLSARADVSDPPLYEILYAKSVHADFHEDVIPLPLVGYQSGQLVTSHRVFELTRAVLDAALKSGAREGARILTASHIDKNNQNHDLTFLNGMPVSYLSGDLMCLANQAMVIDCHCSFSGTAPSP